MTDLPMTAEPTRRAEGSLFSRVTASPPAAAAACFLALVALVAIVGPLIAPHDGNHASVNDVLGPITGRHPLGSDSVGRDVLSRLLDATRYSIAGALLALTIAVLVGVTSGLVAGYYGKSLDLVSSWVADLLQALPGMVILLAARAVLGPSMWTSMAIFGVLLSPAFFRLVHASTSAVRNEMYVDAARVSGLSDLRIIARHVFTVVRAPVIIQAAFITSVAIAIQSGLEFLGLGDLKLPTWGSMLNDGFANIYRDPKLLLWPSLAIALTSISLVLVANALRDALEHNGSSRRRRSKSMPEPVAAPEGAPVLVHPSPVRDQEAVLLDVTDLAVGYEQSDGSFTTVVDRVSLRVHRGEIHGLIGESGSGKTQTAWSVLGLLPEGGRIAGGSIRYGGTELRGASERRLVALRGKDIAYIPQEPMSNLDPSFTIGSQLTEPMRIKMGLPSRQATSRALDLLDRVGIRDPKRTMASYPHQVSGGMAQRVLIAGAVSCEPKLLIADEPTTALDVTVQADVLDLLRDIQAEFRMGMVLVTHNLGVVADICETVSIMQAGRVVETGPVRPVFAEPRHPYTRALLDSVLEDTALPLVPPRSDASSRIGQGG